MKKTYIAMTISAGYTELPRIFVNEEVQNCQVLLIDTALNMGDFLEKVKEMWGGFEIGDIEIREISATPYYFNME